MTNIATTHITIKVAGANLADDVATLLLSIDYESTYDRPDEATIRFSVEPGTDPPRVLELGKGLTLSAKAEGEEADTTFFDGEITAIENEFAEAQFSEVVVIAHDKLHRLFRGDKHKTYKDVKISDVATQIAGANSMSGGTITATTDLFPYLWQHNESDGDFLGRLADQANSFIHATAGKLALSEIGSGASSGVALTFGRQLINFSTRATAKTVVKEVEVRGWDTKEKKAVVGTANAFDAPIDDQVRSAATGFGATKVLLHREGPQSVLDAIAKSAIERAAEPNLQAEGTCYGDPRISVDKTLKIEGVGARFSREYRISAVRHTYDLNQGFRTHFVSRGGADQSLANLVSLAAAVEAPAPDVNHFETVAIGIVTNVDDPDKLGRVRVKLPLIADDLESDWMRTVHPGAGGADSHGLFFLPEVDDEVLVAFEHGDPRRGFVLGGLYNTKDVAPAPNGAVVDQGKINQRLIQTRVGSFLLFDDKQGNEAFELKLKGDNFHIRFEENKGLTLTSKAQGNELLITPEGAVTIKQAKAISIESSDKISLKAALDISIESTGGKVAIKAAAGDATVDGLNVKVNGQVNTEVKGGVAAKLEGGVNATVKGAMVMIN